MTTRTFKQFGQAYGNTPASIAVLINGVNVFSGAVPTENSALPEPPYTGIAGTELFTWTNTVDFAGAQSFSISVENAPLLLLRTVADYVYPQPNELPEFNGFYTYQIDGVTVADPLSNVAIDGVPVQRATDNSGLSGQWNWLIPAGSTLTAILNVTAGVEPPPPAP
jgi:hypothetical protein